MLLIPITTAGRLYAMDSTAESRWSLGIGVGFYSIPDYPGAEHTNNILAPIPYLEYKGPRLTLSNGRISSLLFNSEKIVIDISADGTPPVKSENNGARKEMPDLDPVLEVGPALELYLWRDARNKIFFDVPLRYGLASDFKRTKGIGWLSNPRIKYHFHYQQWRFRAGLGPIYASEKHNNYYYGVDEAFSAAYRQPYSPDRGYSGFLYSLGMQKRQGRLKFDAYFRLVDLAGSERENSPLVKRDKSLLWGSSITWIFSEQ